MYEQSLADVMLVPPSQTQGPAQILGTLRKSIYKPVDRMDGQCTHLSQHTATMQVNWMTAKGLITQGAHHIGFWRAITHIQSGSKSLKKA